MSQLLPTFGSGAVNIHAMRIGACDSWQSFKLPDEHRVRLREIARQQDRSVSALLREMVEVVVSSEAWAEPQDSQRRVNPFVQRSSTRS